MKMIVDQTVCDKTGMCGPGYDNIVKYRTDNNLPLQTYDEILAILKIQNNRQDAIWMLKNRALFVRAGKYTTSPEEDATDAHELELATTLDGSVSGYSFQSTKFPTLAEAENAQQQWVNQQTLLVKETITAVNEQFNEQGHAVWTAVDINNITEIPNNSFIQLFNPVTGKHIQYSTLAEAKTAYAQCIQDTLLFRCGSTPRIFKLMTHSVYGDEYIGEAV